MVILMLSPPFLTALGVVREKESGAIYNVYSSTLSRGEYLIGNCCRMSVFLSSMPVH
jgi:ABC-2 type transport system permease protein/ribosome-dependent ATPase